MHDEAAASVEKDCHCACGRRSFSLAFLVARTATAQMAELELPKAKSVVALVDKAAALVGSKGKAAFDDFRQKGSEWFTGDIYIFCSDMEGTELFNAAFPQFEGKHLIDLKDKSGKAITRAFIAMVEKQGAGWVDYMWPKPGRTPRSKSGLTSSGSMLRVKRRPSLASGYISISKRQADGRCPSRSPNSLHFLDGHQPSKSAPRDDLIRHVGTSDFGSDFPACALIMNGAPKLER